MVTEWACRRTVGEALARALAGDDGVWPCRAARQLLDAGRSPNYTIQVVKGTPSWTPVQVFDDGLRTFVRFPSAMALREAPVLFVLRDSETQLVNYRVKNDTYVIDRRT